MCRFTGPDQINNYVFACIFQKSFFCNFSVNFGCKHDFLKSVVELAPYDVSRDDGSEAAYDTDGRSVRRAAVGSRTQLVLRKDGSCGCR